MSTPPKSALRKAAKGAVMAGTAALAAVAVGTLVKRRLDGTAPLQSAPLQTQPLEDGRSVRLAGSGDGDPLARKESE
jgi:ABC-type phosphate transport system substrate-binding protein